MNSLSQPILTKHSSFAKVCDGSYSLGCKSESTTHSLEIDPMCVDGWVKLANEGGGEVAGRCFSREEAEAEAIKRACEAVEATPDDTFAWQDLGSVDGGQVGGVCCAQSDCCLEALSLGPEGARVWCIKIL